MIATRRTGKKEELGWSFFAQRKRKKTGAGQKARFPFLEVTAFVMTEGGSTDNTITRSQSAGRGEGKK